MGKTGLDDRNILGGKSDMVSDLMELNLQSEREKIINYAIFNLGRIVQMLLLISTRCYESG